QQRRVLGGRLAAGGGVTRAAAAGREQDKAGRCGGEAGAVLHRNAPWAGSSGSASMTTWVALTTALAILPGSSPSSRAASLLIRDTTRKGPHCSSTWAITVSITTSVTRPTKRLRAEEAVEPCSSGAAAISRACRATSVPSSTLRPAASVPALSV